MEERPGAGALAAPEVATAREAGTGVAKGVAVKVALAAVRVALRAVRVAVAQSAAPAEDAVQ